MSCDATDHRETVAVSTKRNRLLLGVALVVVLAGAGIVISSSIDHSSHNGGGPGNQADAEFVSGMIPHHEGAVEMARIAKERAEHPEIERMADQIIAAQEAEIATMAPVREALENEHGEHMSGDHSSTGMDPDELRTAAPFDRAFINMMIPHHEDAVAMAQKQLESGENDELRDLAEQIIATQRREIAQMRGWRSEWYGAGDEARPGGVGGHRDGGH
jgi:uncharacterized protein (DUF305 family)